MPHIGDDIGPLLMNDTKCHMHVNFEYRIVMQEKIGG